MALTSNLNSGTSTRKRLGMNLSATPLAALPSGTNLAPAMLDSAPKTPLGSGLNGLSLNGLELSGSSPVVDIEPGLSSYARCADGNGTLSYLFFSDDDLELARAKAMCRTCGLQETCLSGAIERVEPYGVWGGKLVLDGVPVEVKRKRGRPPRVPRPVLIVDEAPIPPHLVA